MACLGGIVPVAAYLLCSQSARGNLELLAPATASLWVAGATFVAVLGALILAQARRLRPRAIGGLLVVLATVLAWRAGALGVATLSSSGEVVAPSVNLLRRARPLAPSVQALQLESLDAQDRPLTYVLVLVDGRRYRAPVALVTSAALDALARGQSPSPTLGIVEGSQAAQRVEALLVEIARAPREGAAYLTLHGLGSPIAARLLAAARTQGALVEDDATLAADALTVVASTLMERVVLAPEVGAELRAKLDASLGLDLEIAELTRLAVAGGDLGILDRLIALLQAESARVRLLAWQSLMTLVVTADLPPGLGGAPPGATDRAAWQRLAGRWQAWLDRDRGRLVHARSRWVVDRPALSLLSVIECAAKERDCLEQVIAALAAPDEEARALAADALGALVCSTALPVRTRPEHPLDESWQDFVAAWSAWLARASESLELTECDGARRWSLRE